MHKTDVRAGTMPAFLIINADDYGYFNGVSRGILALAENGTLTATGIFANSVHFAEHMEWLRNSPGLDAGVHLNLTDGTPLSPAMQERAMQWGGRFPRKFSMALAVAAGRVKMAIVEQEWRAQIERCLESGIQIRFLNSHEHIHMLPPLFRLAHRLAADYDIPHVRYATAEWLRNDMFNGFSRNLIMMLLTWLDRPFRSRPAPLFLGMSESGRLSLDYMVNRLAELRPGKVYELMCHPGFHDRGEVHDPRLLSYHDWEGELQVLQSERIRELCATHNVRLIRYRDLEYQGDVLAIRGMET